MRWLGLALLVGVCGCKQPVAVSLRYKVNVPPADVVRIETKVSVASPDDRMFFADQPYRSVAEGIGYEVRDFSGAGHRSLLITHDATIGFAPSPTFVFTLLPPVASTAPPLTISAQVFGIDTALGQSPGVPAAFGPGAFVEVVIDDQRCGGRTCASDELCCGTSCVKVASDRSHCGSCDLACAGTESCSGGICRCEGGSGCATGSACCPGIGCLDLSSDAFNCGACGHACNPGESCAGGACGCPSSAGGAACAAGELCCSATGCTTTGSCQCNNTPCSTPSVCCNNNSCVDFATDGKNCGHCNNKCAAGLLCNQGQCKCAGSVCAGSDVCCAGVGCKNTQNDPANCGGCGRVCGEGQVCAAGLCVCGTSGLSCDPMKPLCCPTVSQCVNPGTDHENCGRCGKQCKTLEVCTANECTCDGGPACAVGNRCCADTGGCVDVATSQKNCGGCNSPCGNNETCVNGKCTASICTCLVGTCCGGMCVDTQKDTANCGGCNKPCVAGQLCCDGHCRDQDEKNCGSCDETCMVGAPKGLGRQCCFSCSVPSTGSCISSALSCPFCPMPR